MDSTSEKRCSTYPGVGSRRLDLTGFVGVSKVLFGQLTHLRQPGVGSDRDRPLPAQLDPVVLRRVVRGGDHGTGNLAAAGDEIDDIRRHLTQREHAGPLADHPLDEGVPQRRRGQPAVVSHRNGVGPGEPGERCPHLAGNVLVELTVVGAAPDVVCLEDQIEVHGPLILCKLTFAVVRTLAAGMSQPTVTVVIPVHNEAEILAAALETLFGQLEAVDADVARHPGRERLDR